MKYIKQSVIVNRLINNRFFNHFPRTVIQSSSKQGNDKNKYKSQHLPNPNTIILATSITTLLAYKLYDYSKNVVITQKNAPVDFNSVGAVKLNIPYYSIQEVSEHNTKEKRIWVTFKEGVYDITDFIIEHPGGEQILLAAGSSVEPFWMLYAVHNDQHVLQLLEKFRIGNISLNESQHFITDLTDPYSTDPQRHQALKIASRKPFNAETPPFLLVEHFITPNELFYVRNHLPVPHVDLQTYELEIEVEGQKKLNLSLDDLKKMPKHTITATIMCAGNRRSEMTEVKPVKGLNWGIAAVGNATWTGVRLRDVLERAGVRESDTKWKHVQFEGLDFDPTGKTYGASVPFWKAMSSRGDVLLAYEMNAVPIPKDHGFPIRVIVPGVVGARNVKWLGKIIVSEKESESHWQQNDYKGFSPSTDWDTVDFSKSPAIQELPVISAICKPSDGETVRVVDGHILVKGYAWSGGGQKIIRVDITGDGGNTWHVAKIEAQDSAEPPQHWSWTLWSARVPVEPGTKKMELWAKAVDSTYNTQPESFKNIWNLRGVLSNAYHRVKIELQ